MKDIFKEFLGMVKFVLITIMFTSVGLVIFVIFLIPVILDLFPFLNPAYGYYG